MNITTVSINVSPDWSLERAFNELVANAIDAHIQAKVSISKIKLTYGTSNRVFQIADLGTGIRIENLNSGGSTKREEDESIHGYHGKGLMESVAVLLRNDYQVFIHSVHMHVRFVTHQDCIGYISYPVDEDTIGTKITILHRRGFKNVIRTIEKAFTNFQTVGELLDDTCYGRVYLPPKNEEGGVYLNGYRLNIGKGHFHTLRFTYDLRNSSKIQKFVKNSNSANTRNVESVTIRSEIIKIHKEVQNPTTIKLANETRMNRQSYEFTSKLLSDVYINKTGKEYSLPNLDDEKLVIQYVSTLNIPEANISSNSISITLYDLNDDTAAIVRQFADEHDILYR